MSATYFGVPVLGWALAVWAAIAGTYLCAKVYRALIAVKEQDELFIAPSEMGRIDRDLLRVDRWARRFGVASVVLLIAIAAVFVSGRA